MTFAVPKKQRPLVYIETALKYYARYVGRQCYGAFVSHRELDRYEIESFRTDPEAWLTPVQIDPTRPEAA
jgi:hypothetical protein